MKMESVIQQTEKEPVFSPKRKWYIPRSVFVLTALPKEEWKKLKAWKDKGDSVTIECWQDSEVCILNWDKLERIKQRRLERRLTQSLAEKARPSNAK